MPEYNPPADAFYTEIIVPSHISPEKFIGREGFHLKRITELSRCDYIWLDFNRSVIEIWSYEERYLAKAIRMLSRRMASFPIGAPPPKRMKTLSIETRLDGPYTFVYDITGNPSECILEFSKIHQEYPTNPYFTKIVSVEVTDGTMKLVVSRSTTSD